MCRVFLLSAATPSAPLGGTRGAARGGWDSGTAGKGKGADVKVVEAPLLIGNPDEEGGSQEALIPTAHDVPVHTHAEGLVLLP